MSSQLGQIRPLIAASCKLAIRPCRRPTILNSHFSTSGFTLLRKANRNDTKPPSPHIPSLTKPLKDESLKQDGHKHSSEAKPSRSRSLRPLTLLLLCIPLGYILRWSTSSSSASRNEIMTPDGFTKYTLVSREDISPSLAIFTLAPPSPEASLETSTILGEDGGTTDAAAGGAGMRVLSVQVKQPLLQIARDYTLLPPPPPPSTSQSTATEGTAEEGDAYDGTLRLLIRREERGEMSGYLFRLGIGSEVQVRGPNVEFGITASLSLSPSSNEHEHEKAGDSGVGKILFLAGGTGIATALALVGSMTQCDGLEGMDVRVLWAVRKREECLGGGDVSSKGESTGVSWMRWLWAGNNKQKNEVAPAPTIEDSRNGPIVQQLEDLKTRLEDSESGSKARRRSNSMRVGYYVDEEGTFIRPNEVAARLAKANAEPPRDIRRRLLFVSGPEGFVEYWAGPKAWVGGRETQGPLGGVLAGMDLRGWDVIKL